MGHEPSSQICGRIVVAEPGAAFNPIESEIKPLWACFFAIFPSDLRHFQAVRRFHAFVLALVLGRGERPHHGRGVALRERFECAISPHGPKRRSDDQEATWFHVAEIRWRSARILGSKLSLQGLFGIVRVEQHALSPVRQSLASEKSTRDRESPHAAKPCRTKGWRPPKPA